MRVLGVTLQFYRSPGAHDAGGLAAMTKTQAGALLVLPHPFTYVHARRIAELAAQSRLPAVYPFREAVEAGGLMGYPANAPAMFRRAATYVDKIVKGAKPADLPIEQPTQFELVIKHQDRQGSRPHDPPIHPDPSGRGDPVRGMTPRPAAEGHAERELLAATVRVLSGTEDG